MHFDGTKGVSGWVGRIVLKLTVGGIVPASLWPVPHAFRVPILTLSLLVGASGEFGVDGIAPTAALIRRAIGLRECETSQQG